LKKQCLILLQPAEFENEISADYKSHYTITPQKLIKTERLDFSDKHLALLTGRSEADIRGFRKSSGVQPSFKIADTCAAEFESFTPYYYSTCDPQNESVGVGPS
jgi:carbamoyl-phosphate synthase large subunit